MHKLENIGLVVGYAGILWLALLAFFRPFDQSTTIWAVMLVIAGSVMLSTPTLIEYVRKLNRR